MSAGEIVKLATDEGAADETTDTGKSDKKQPYKMQDLMQAIADRTELKRSELREAAGLVCEAIGQALDDGQTVSLPGLGKITPRKRDSKPGGDMLTARIKLVQRGEKLADMPADDEVENP